jgi:hypothetical protein
MIACAENAIVTKLDSKLLLESVLDVDLGDDTEGFLLEGLRCAAPRFFKTNWQRHVEIKSHCILVTRR